MLNLGFGCVGIQGLQCKVGDLKLRLDLECTCGLGDMELALQALHALVPSLHTHKLQLCTCFGVRAKCKRFPWLGICWA